MFSLLRFVVALQVALHFVQGVRQRNGTVSHVGDAELTVGFEVEFSPLSLALVYSNCEGLCDHVPMFTTEEVTFQLETQARPINEGCHGAILEAVSKPFSVATKVGLDGLKRAVGQVREIVSNVNTILRKERERHGWLVWRQDVVNSAASDVAPFAVLQPACKNVQFKLGTSLKAALVNPQVTATYALADVHDVFSRGYIAQECSPTSEYRTAVMQDSARKASALTATLADKFAKACKLKDCVFGKRGPLSEVHLRQMRSFLTMLINDARGVMRGNLPNTSPRQACRVFTDGKCQTKFVPTWGKDLFGLLSKTPLHMVFLSMSSRVQKFLNAHVAYVQSVILEGVFDEYQALQRLWFEDNVKEWKEMEDFTKSSDMGRLLLMSGEPLILESYFAHVFESVPFVYHLREVEPAKLYWGNLMHDNTATAIMYPDVGPGMRVAFEYRELFQTVECLDRVLGCVVGYACGSGGEEY